jgi:hypothetical protein
VRDVLKGLAWVQVRRTETRVSLSFHPGYLLDNKMKLLPQTYRNIDVDAILRLPLNGSTFAIS